MNNIKINCYISLIFSIVLLSSCSTVKTLDTTAPVESTEQAYYSSAKEAFKNNNYTQAVEMLEELESRYPFGHYAEQAQLDLIYAHYNSFEHYAAREAADRFIRLHPKHEEIDYAYYMRGLASFTQDKSIFDRFIPTDLTKRDTSSAKESIDDFSLLLSLFPDSIYAEDARARVIYLRNLLAAYEIHVARYYIKRKAFIAAANRGRYVVENFQKTPSIPDGLAIMVEAYQQLGLNNLADQSLAVLALNYPEHKILGQTNTTITNKKSLLNRVTFGIFGNTDKP